MSAELFRLQLEAENRALAARLASAEADVMRYSTQAIANENAYMAMKDQAEAAEAALKTAREALLASLPVIVDELWVEEVKRILDQLHQGARE